MTTLLLIPGLVSDARVWRAVAQAAPEWLSAANADITREPTIEDMAARLLRENDGPLIPVGHSLGGRVAMEMAHQAPERVRGLVLANTGHDGVGENEAPKRLAKIARGYEDMTALAAEWLPPMLAEGVTPDPALVDDLTDMVLKAGPDIHARQIRAIMERPNAMDYIADIACPVLLLTGAQDSWSPEKQHREIAEKLAVSELQIIDGAGHFMPVERPDETVAAITGWLDQHKEVLNV
ncbi:alpha/beta fold hydrolase [Martelella radicis]|uniref:Pimeloyl-ACP methyl ester carboxylesterase n=1 Tax=Martelella radicis TaxID=1397476 RepID=A0A7W6KN03_9HYPH|nr:alpha/beta hydrolase [Martelella radicis]MBB4124246.1 pimeloyl-ACP methyl ester carboxylesterase [Martelella radicis]